MGGEFSKKENIGPLYFNACSDRPKCAVTFSESLYSENMEDMTQEERKAMEKICLPFLKEEAVDEYLVPGRMHLFTFTSTDPNCMLICNETDIRLGKGTFTFLKIIAWATTFTIKHQGAFTVYFYDFPDDILTDLSKVSSINFHLPSETEGSTREAVSGESTELYAYRGGAMGKIPKMDGENSKPLDAILQCSYNHKRIEVNSKSGYVYSHTIGTLQNHPKMFENEELWQMKWDKEFIRSSYPPCIAVSVNENYLDNFRKLAEEVCPDFNFKPSEKYDTVEIPQSDEDKRQQEDENMRKLLDSVERVINLGLLSRTPY